MTPAPHWPCGPSDQEGCRGGTGSWTAGIKWGAGPETWGGGLVPSQLERLHLPGLRGPACGRMSLCLEGGWPSSDGVDRGTSSRHPAGPIPGWPGLSGKGAVEGSWSPSWWMCTEGSARAAPGSEDRKRGRTDCWGSGPLLGSAPNGISPALQRGGLPLTASDHLQVLKSQGEAGHSALPPAHPSGPPVLASHPPSQ